MLFKTDWEKKQKTTTTTLWNLKDCTACAVMAILSPLTIQDYIVYIYTKAYTHVHAFIHIDIHTESMGSIFGDVSSLES